MWCEHYIATDLCVGGKIVRAKENQSSGGIKAVVPTKETDIKLEIIVRLTLPLNFDCLYETQIKHSSSPNINSTVFESQHEFNSL